MRYTHIRIFDKMLPVGIEPATLTHAAQNITQLTKCSGWGPGAPTVWFTRWASFPTLGQSAHVRARQVAKYALANVQMLYMRIRTFAIKCPHVGLEPATLTTAAQTITQLTK